MAKEIFTRYLHSEKGLANLTKDLEVLKALMPSGMAKYFSTTKEREAYLNTWKKDLEPLLKKYNLRSVSSESSDKLWATDSSRDKENAIRVEDIFSMLYKYKTHQAADTLQLKGNKAFETLVDDLEDCCNNILDRWQRLGSELISYETYSTWWYDVLKAEESMKSSEPDKGAAHEKEKKRL